VKRTDEILSKPKVKQNKTKEEEEEKKECGLFKQGSRQVQHR
jgi:hypothetical protein